MATKILGLSQLNLDDVRDRVYQKYKITHSDAELAVEYLHCFFDAKRDQLDELIILPQIADWAWHELILDTVRYREVCGKIFGAFLHHIAKTIGSEEPSDHTYAQSACWAGYDHTYSSNRSDHSSKDLHYTFRRSMHLFRDTYGLSLGERPDEWLEAGWSRPRYRLRSPVRITSDNKYLDGKGEKNSSYDGRLTRLFSWLPARIAQRFDVPIAAATQGVEEYVALFSSLRNRRGLQAQVAGSPACQIAWEEHILWTRQYEEDCNNILGHFLDHSPRPILQECI